MNCFEEIELVINYIESIIMNTGIYNDVDYESVNHIGSTGDIDMSAISKLTGVPSGLYQRIFSYICGVSISEYVRKRRLTLAGNDILHNKSSVINIAIKYGYDSHSAFTRAFKDQFGVPPTSLTKDIYQVGAYSRFTFQDDKDSYYVMKGRRIMADIVKIDYVEMEEQLLIGIAKSEGMDAPKLWGKYFEGGFSERLGALEEYQSEVITDDYIGLGYATDFKDDKSLGNEYVIGRYYKLGTPVPDNMISRIIPKSIIAKAQIRGKNLDDIINNAYILVNDMAKKNGYKIDYKHFYWLEVYTYNRYCIPADKGEEIILDWYMPCMKEIDKSKLREISAKEHYDNLIEDNNDPVNDSESLKEYMDKWDGSIFFEQLGDMADRSILEIGIGTGRLALKVLEKNCKCFVGIDISEKTIKRAEENLSRYSNYSLILGDYLTKEIDRTFDIVYSSLTFFHIRDKVRAIQNTWELLNENGKFVLSIEKNTEGYLEYGQYKVKLYPDELDQTVKLLKECGFIQLNTIETEFAYIVSAIKSGGKLVK